MRRVRTAALAAVVAAVGFAVPGAADDVGVTASWQLKWAPSAARDGLAAFEGVEDDHAGSHPAGAPHIKVEVDTYRFTMHMVDRDTHTDRQRQEVKGMRSPAGGPYLELKHGETWRLTYQMRIPTTLRATTTFTHIFQTKAPGTGTSPMVVMSLRRHGTTPKIELKAGSVLVGAIDLVPVQNRWIDVDLEMRIADSGRLRWRIHDEGRQLIDVTRDGVDTWLFDRVRPKWGIYRSLGDTSGSLRDCHLNIRNLRAYKWA
ncbi:hypothetical protein GCM10023148_05860 [Actinokineospora soli]